MHDQNKKEKSIDITGMCVNCRDRKNCDFITGVNTHIRDNRSASCVSDAEITVYSCDSYEAEVEQVCDESNMCISCNKEE